VQVRIKLCVFAEVSDLTSVTGFPFVLFLEGMSHDHFSGCSNVPLVDLLDSAFTSLEECSFPHPAPGVVSYLWCLRCVGAIQSGICLVKLAQL
jgi:hypothetical protein